MSKTNQTYFIIKTVRLKTIISKANRNLKDEFRLEKHTKKIDKTIRLIGLGFTTFQIKYELKLFKLFDAYSIITSENDLFFYY